MNKPTVPDAFDLQAYLEKKRALINETLTRLLAYPQVGSRVCEAMHYSLMASGKRLRPVLCIAAAETVGDADTRVLEAACAIEMIHTYSLIHDDLPAMDDDALRRGQPTCHVRFDEATAILAGDALLTLAFEILATSDDAETDAGRRLEIIRIVASAAGYRGMIEGQMRDIEAEGGKMALAPLKEMHDLKTGALIKGAVMTGALLAGGNARQIDALVAYAENVGLAFQVTDDILNVEGDPKEMGKAAGTDLARGKSTYPSLMGLKRSKEYAEELINNALRAIVIFDNKAKPLTALSQYILERNR